jgi:pyridoxal phosphate enzyme (YggS family)
VSKFHSVEAIREAYDAGERHFGESRVQELKQKIPLLPDDIHWHFIGHLQTNKVRDLLKLRPYLIHSVDSERLLNALNEEAIKQGIVQNILLEIHVAKEETKTGLSKTQVRLILDHSATVWHGLRIVGLMAMATNTDDETEIRRCFEEAAKCLNDAINDQMVNNQMVNNPAVLSMGMSDDYRIAIECGSNMVRIGSTIFGKRTYT